MGSWRLVRVLMGLLGFGDGWGVGCGDGVWGFDWSGGEGDC